MTDFQKNWLRFWAWGVVLFGAAIALFAFSATEGPMRLFFDAILGRPFGTEVDPHARFAMGLMGCVTLGWGLTFRTAFEAGHALNGHAASKFWRGILLATLAWYVTDGIASIHIGFWRNAISNTVLAVLLLIPILQSGVLKGRAT